MEALDRIVTVSNDGKMCTWSLENITKPVEVMELKQKSWSSNTPAVMSLTFMEDNNKFVVGTEEGQLCEGKRYGG